MYTHGVMIKSNVCMYIDHNLKVLYTYMYYVHMYCMCIVLCMTLCF